MHQCCAGSQDLDVCPPLCLQVDPLTSCHVESLPLVPERWRCSSLRPYKLLTTDGMMRNEPVTRSWKAEGSKAEIQQLPGKEPSQWPGLQDDSLPKLSLGSVLGRCLSNLT